MSKKKTGKKSNTPLKSKQSSTKQSWSVFQGVPHSDNQDWYRKLFWIVFAVIAVVTLLMAVQTGVNEDDKFHYAYSDLLVKFYTTFGEDQSALHVESGKMHLYGGFVDTSTRILNGIFGFEQSDAGFHVIRHILLAFIGLISFLFAGLIGRHIGGWRMGLLAMVILFLSPRFLGHTGINPRDMPFASGYIMSIYFMLRFFSEIPKVSWKTVLGLAGGIGLALGARSGALLLVAYFGLFGLIHLFLAYRDQQLNKDRLLMKYIIPGGLGVIGGYILALLFWPYGLTKPIANVLNSIREFSNFSTVLRMLFQGDMQWSNNIPPGNYISTWLLIAMPILLLLGVVLFIVFSRGVVKRYNRFYIGVIAFVFLFPISYIISKQSNLYTAMRHILFVVPPLAILAAFGWEYVLSKFENSRKPYYYTAIGAIGVLSLLPLSHIVMNFKTCYVYFNALNGGVKGALGEYELDYWGVSIKRAVDWMADEGIFDTDEEIVIGCNSNFVLKQYVAPYENVRVAYSRFRERYERDWDYGVYINQFIDGAHLRTGDFLDNNVIKTFGKGDVPFVIIYKNSTERYATKGFEALKANQMEEAIRLFSAEVEQNPKNENAWIGLGQAYLNRQQFQPADQAFSRALAINPESQVALTYGGMAAVNVGQLDQALDFFQRAERLNNRDVTALYYQGVIYSRKGDTYNAILKLEAAVQANPSYRPTYELLIQILSQQGDTQKVNYYRQVMQQYAR